MRNPVAVVQKETGKAPTWVSCCRGSGPSAAVPGGLVKYVIVGG